MEKNEPIELSAEEQSRLLSVNPYLKFHEKLIDPMILVIDGLPETKNVRLSTNESYEHIADNQFIEKGILVPPIITKIGEKYHVLDGRNRVRLVQDTKKSNPELFARHFGNGLKCTIIEGATKPDIVRIVCNHDTARGLRSKAEMCMSYMRRREAGMPEILISRESVEPMSILYRPDAVKLAEYQKAQKENNRTAANKLLYAMFHSAFQVFERFFKLPEFVFHCWKAKEEGKETLYPTFKEYPQFWQDHVHALILLGNKALPARTENTSDKEYADQVSKAWTSWSKQHDETAKTGILLHAKVYPNTSTRDYLIKLEKAFNEDSDSLFDGKRVWTKENYGPRFRKLFLEYVDKTRNIGVDDGSVPAMKSKEVTDQASVCASKGLKDVLKKVIGGKDVPKEADFKTVDKMVNTMEYVTSMGLTIEAALKLTGSNGKTRLLDLCEKVALEGHKKAMSLAEEAKTQDMSK